MSQRGSASSGWACMGSALAQRLLGAGYAVLGFDIDRKRQPALEKMGGTFAASLPELAHRCHTMFLAVFDTEQVEAVVEGTLLSAIGSNSGKIILCASTCDPDRIAALGGRIEPQGLICWKRPSPARVSRCGKVAVSPWLAATRRSSSGLPTS